MDRSLGNTDLEGRNYNSNLTGPGANPTNFHFFGFPIFAVKLGHLVVKHFFSIVTNTQAYQRKTEKIFVSKEKKFGRIDSWSSFEIVY